MEIPFHYEFTEETIKYRGREYLVRMPTIGTAITVTRRDTDDIEVNNYVVTDVSSKSLQMVRVDGSPLSKKALVISSPIELKLTNEWTFDGKKNKKCSIIIGEMIKKLSHRP